MEGTSLPDHFVLNSIIRNDFGDAIGFVFQNSCDVAPLLAGASNLALAL